MSGCRGRLRRYCSCSVTIGGGVNKTETLSYLPPLPSSQLRWVRCALAPTRSCPSWTDPPDAGYRARNEGWKCRQRTPRQSNEGIEERGPGVAAKRLVGKKVGGVRQGGTPLSWGLPSPSRSGMPSAMHDAAQSCPMTSLPRRQLGIFRPELTRSHPLQVRSM